MKTLPKKVIIDNQTWLRGGNSPDGLSSLLHHESRQRCCVGFVAKEMGFEDRGMEGEAYMSELCLDNDNIDDPFHELGVYDINDNRNIKDHRRRQMLKRKFKKIGIELEFIN
jgi:hypothetical protein